MAKIWVSYREDPEMLASIDETADRLGMTRSEVLRDAVRKYLAGNGAEAFIEATWSAD